MARARRRSVLLVLTTCVLLVQACGQARTPHTIVLPQPPANLQVFGATEPLQAAPPSTVPSSDASAPPLDLMITKSMLYAAGLEFNVNPYLVMGLAWHESGWQASVVSYAGAVGIMQVMPSTAAHDGPALLHRAVNLFDPGDNIEMGTAILKADLDRYDNDLAKALTAYYAGDGSVTDWAHLRADCRRYVWAVYNAAMMFKDGRGPA